MSNLRQQWEFLWHQLGLTGDPAVLYGIIEQCYSQPHRRHHTLRHLREGLAEPALISALEPNLVEWVWFFHDIIYDPLAQPGVNERASAGLSYQIGLMLGLAPDFLRRASIMIEASAQHTPSDDPDTQLMLDVDMAIVGRPPLQYEVYAHHIMDEFVPIIGLARYVRGRRQFLQELVGRRIFQTESFGHLEKPAQDNIKWELEYFLPRKRDNE
ncbi:MAG TPA: hypothetical protein VLF41_01850 [Candidatus Nanoarchaeia archaeon]|nr:hypothetical protein [Candidatus Nanoarchaeia archaeon]